MAQLVPVETFDLIIFGGTGDLAMRKLLPALYHRDRDGQITADSRIIAASRGALTQEDYLATVEASLRSNLAAGDFDETHWQSFSKRLHYAQADAFEHSDWGDLVDVLAGPTRDDARRGQIRGSREQRHLGPVDLDIATQHIRHDANALLRHLHANHVGFTILQSTADFLLAQAQAVAIVAWRLLVGGLLAAQIIKAPSGTETAKRVPLINQLQGMLAIALTALALSIRSIGATHIGTFIPLKSQPFD